MNATEYVDAYIDAWNEPAADRRAEIIAEVMTGDCAYVDPAKQLYGQAALVECIGELLDRHPGRRIVRTSEVDAHHLVCRFTWQLVNADGTTGPESIDFVEFAEDGRISRVTGFFGPTRRAER